jgi:hypothetical protein
VICLQISYHFFHLQPILLHKSVPMNQSVTDSIHYSKKLREVALRVASSFKRHHTATRVTQLVITPQLNSADSETCGIRRLTDRIIHS